MRIRPLGIDDADFYADLYCDPEVTRWVCAPLTRTQSMRCCNAAVRAGTHELAELDGSPLALLCARKRAPYLELGILLSKAWWRRGMGTQIMGLWLRQPLLCQERLAMWIAEENRPMCRLAKRLGFVQAPQSPRLVENCVNNSTTANSFRLFLGATSPRGFTP